MLNNKELLKKSGFLPKENESEIFCKKFPAFGDYIIEVDFSKNKFDFGSKIKSDRDTTQNFSQEENWVVFECANRLLEKGYKPEDIILEKTWQVGHGASGGRLDILVNKNKWAYLMTECKTWGAEFDKAFKKLQKDGGQLFTYFQQDKKAEYLMLYTSNFDGKEISHKNEIIKIEEHYREAGNVKDFYDRWNKLAKQNGIFDDWVNAYEFQSKALTRKDLKIIKQEDSSFIFNRFLEILRHNVVSDKPNAFNKIFTLFLCKIIDEYKGENEQLGFQWLEGEDNNISFQKRLTDLYKRGMKELLEKEVKDLSDNDFNNKYQNIDDSIRKKILDDFTEIRLKKNNEFAFKEVFDDPSFDDNAKAVKEVVELLQGYQLRYNQKHQYLGDFFEMLLTTGLKQESGQFFTPVPIAKYIIKSLPIKEIIDEKIKKGNPNDLLPFIIDYAAGSGHFLTESMDEVQKMIDKIDEEKLNHQPARKIKSWKSDQFNWALEYIYGIEKDYRLVKTAKVGCYLHGDGLAKVIHGDGLQTFGVKPLDQGSLKETDNKFSQDNKQFDIVISNPPYSVSAFKGTLNEESAKNSFELFSKLTDQSSEIECLFIERTKQLLKDGGFAGIILPSSILSNAGIYTKAREILFKYFEIVAITELGSGTFMATGTNTVILFLRRRTNYEWENIQSSVDKFFQDYKDVTVNGIENIFSKYAKQIWDKVNFEDYVSLCQNKPNETIKNSDIFKEYEKKIKAKNDEEKQKIILEIEKEKLLYFILAYPQKVVVVKSGKKKEEKAFLGYEFSNRRGYEGIHPIQRSKSIDEYTKMFDIVNQENPEKANSYVYRAFLGELDMEIDESMKKYVFQANLVEMMTFDRVDFEKTISLTIKKTLKIESKWELVRLGDVCELDYGTRIVRKNEEGKIYPVYGGGDETFKSDSYNRENVYIISRFGMSPECVRLVKEKFFLNDSGFTVKPLNSQILNQNYLNIFLFSIQELIYNCGRGVAQKNIDIDQFKSIKIPLPPKEIQEKIVKELEKLEEKEDKDKNKKENLTQSIKNLIPQNITQEKIEDITILLKRGKSPKYGNSNIQIIKSGQARGYKNFDFTEKYFASQDFIIDERKLENGDVLINSTGVGTAGRVTLFDLEDDYLVDSHITILRLNKNKILPDFVLYYLADVVGFKNIEAMALGQSGQIELSLETIKHIKIPVPSLSEQQKIVAQIQKIEDQVSKLNQELKEIKNQKAEILKKYL